MTDRTAEFFDRYARDFDAIYGNRNTMVNTVVNTLFRRSMRLRYQLTMEGCQPIAGKTVLDVGCGPGHYGIELAKRGAARVHGIDFAEGMLDIARGGAERAGVGDRCTFEQADFHSRDLKGPYDYVIVMGFMDYVADPQRMVRRTMELTGSRAFFSFPLDGGPLAWQRRVRYRSRCDLYLYSEDSVRRIFADAGQKRVDIKQIDRDLFVTAHAG
jgi:2-polyprenyl-3-methyl-5-hydroxy-6-metoxy-1,4-benzoquinol methylase